MSKSSSSSSLSKTTSTVPKTTTTSKVTSTTKANASSNAAKTTAKASSKKTASIKPITSTKSKIAETKTSVKTSTTVSSTLMKSSPSKKSTQTLTPTKKSVTKVSTSAKKSPSTKTTISKTTSTQKSSVSKVSSPKKSVTSPKKTQSTVGKAKTTTVSKSPKKSSVKKITTTSTSPLKSTQSSVKQQQQQQANYLSFESDAVISNGRYIIYSQDSSIFVWDIEIENCIHIFNGHTSNVHSLSICKTSPVCISSSYNETLVWNFISNKVIKSINGSRVVSFHPSLDKIAYSNPHGFSIFDISRAQTKNIKLNKIDISSIAWIPNNDAIVCGSKDSSLRIYKSNTGTLEKALTGHNSCVEKVMCTPDGKFCFSRSRDQTIKCWDISNGKCIWTKSGKSNSCIELLPMMIFSPNNKDNKDSESKNNNEKCKIEALLENIFEEFKIDCHVKLNEQFVIYDEPKFVSNTYSFIQGK